MDSNQLLLLNMDILAVAAGYTRREFLKHVWISSSNYSHKLVRGGPLTDDQVRRIERFIKSTNDSWLVSVFEDAKTYLLPKSRICTYGTEPIPNRSPKTILQTNLRAFRYFFNLSTEVFAKESKCARGTINSIESGRIPVADKTYEKIYLYLQSCDALSGPDKHKERIIFKMGCRYPITTKIPDYVRC